LIHFYKRKQEKNRIKLIAKWWLVVEF